MLPKIQQPTFEFTIPSTKKKVKMRPMLVKDEKVLLIAKQSGERAGILNGIKQVLANCIVTPGVTFDNLAIFDLEYLFLKLRAISISNVTKVSYKDREDDKTYDFEIDLDKLEIDLEKAPSNKIAMEGTDLLIELSWPSVELYTKSAIYEATEDKVFDVMLLNCLNKVYQGDKAFDAKTTSEDEKKEFIDNIPAKMAEDIRNFFGNVPSLYYKITYKNSKGTDREIELTTLDDFFML